jgi:hypothetical protein
MRDEIDPFTGDLSQTLWDADKPKNQMDISAADMRVWT